MVPLAASITAGDLDDLHRLHLEGECEVEGVLVLLHALRQGACPQLRQLGDFFLLHQYLPGTNERLIGEAPEEMEKKMQALAETLEERKKLGTCDGLENLEGNWTQRGSVEARKRLLRVLLPSLTYLPMFYYPEFEFSMGSVLKEVGAPFL